MQEPALPGPGASVSEARDAYLALGLVPLPLWALTPTGCECPRGDRCATPGKHPKIKGWQVGEAQDIAKDWRWHQPGCGVGLRMGPQPCGIFLVAIDDDGGLAELEQRLGSLPRTVVQLTGRGTHLFFRAPIGVEIANTQRKDGAAIDVRGIGGFVVAAPTLHVSGKRYEWENDWQTPPALPEAWVRHLTTPKRAASPVPYVPADLDEDRLLKRARAYIAKRDIAIEGSNGSRATFQVAIDLIKGFALRRDQARAVLVEYSATCQPPWSDREIEHKLDSAEKSRAELGYLLRDDPRPPLTVHQGGRAQDLEQAMVKPLLVEPIAFDEPEVPAYTEMQTDWLPPAARDLADAAQKALELPAVLMAMGTMTAIAAAVQGKAYVRISDSWTEPLSLWWLVVAATGQGKSEAHRLCVGPLYDWQTEHAETIRPKARLLAAKRSAAEKRIAKLAQDLTQLPSQFSPQAGEIHSELEGLCRELEETPLPETPHLVVSDVTPPTMIDVLEYNRRNYGHACVAVLHDEATWLENLMGRFASGAPMLETALAGYSGGAVSRARKRPDTGSLVMHTIPHVHLTVGLAVQPTVLEKLKASPMLSDKGFMGRLMVHVAPPVPERLLRSTPIPSRVSERYAQMLQRLLDWKPEKPIEIDLRPLHDIIEPAYRSVNETGGDGAEATRFRIIGRCCRMAALVVLGCAADSEMPFAEALGNSLRAKTIVTVSRREGGPEREVTGSTSLEIARRVLNVIIERYIPLDIERMRAIDRPDSPVERLAARVSSALGVPPTPLRQLIPGQLISLRDIQRFLRISKDETLEVAEALIDDGWLSEPVKERHGKRGARSACWRVLKTNAKPKETAQKMADVVPIQRDREPGEDDE